MVPSATPPAPTRGVFVSRVVDNIPLCREHFRLVVEVEDFPPAEPGQFLQIQCREISDLGWAGGAFIRRPFSIGGLRRDGHRAEMDILHRAIGPGTHWLARLRAGDTVSVIGPLGQPFPIPTDRKRAYLVGGGIGLPPLIWLAEALRRAGIPAIAFCGARSSDLIPLTRQTDVAISGDTGSLAYEEFACNQTPVVLSTDDGSLGFAGRIPDAFSAHLSQNPPSREAVVYTCGPEIMMRATADIAEHHDVPCYVCLERVMACGMGTCQSCVVPVHDESATDGWRYRLCCTDGPVFRSREVIWEDHTGH